MKQSQASRTAEYMALFRALETAAPAPRRLFTDIYAQGFLRPQLRLVARLAHARLPAALITRVIDSRWPGARSSGIARTRYIDDLCREALRDGIEQVVILGAGFDARAYRLPEMQQARIFEVDHPATLAAKQRLLRQMHVAAPANITYTTIDFNSEALAEVLPVQGFDPARRTLFLWEGVTNYLSAEAVDATFQFLRSAAPGSRIIFTYIHRDVLAHPESFAGTQALAQTLRGVDESWTFGFDPAELPGYLQRRGLGLLTDLGSIEYRTRYMGEDAHHQRGYTFYRVAVAEVQPSTAALAGATAATTGA